MSEHLDQEVRIEIWPQPTPLEREAVITAISVLLSEESRQRERQIAVKPSAWARACRLENLRGRDPVLGHTWSWRSND